MSQNQGSRKRRGRGRGGRSSSSQAAEHQASIQNTPFEDAQTFWARSNARLGMDASYFGTTKGGSGKGGRAPVEFPCAVCGGWVLLERWPKDRHDVRCDNCTQAVGSLLSGDERKLAVEFRKSRKAAAKGRYEGLPEMSEEDLEAVREVRAMADAMGNGRVGNRRGKGGGGKGNRRRRKGSGGGDGRRRGGGGGGGEGRGGRGRGGRGRGGGGGGGEGRGGRGGGGEGRGGRGGGRGRGGRGRGGGGGGGGGGGNR